MVFGLVDTSGRIYLTAITDPQGNSATLTYDALAGLPRGSRSHRLLLRPADGPEHALDRQRQQPGRGHRERPGGALGRCRPRFKRKASGKRAGHINGLHRPPAGIPHRHGRRLTLREDRQQWVCPGIFSVHGHRSRDGWNQRQHPNECHRIHRGVQRVQFGNASPAEWKSDSKPRPRQQSRRGPAGQHTSRREPRRQFRYTWNNTVVGTQNIQIMLEDADGTPYLGATVPSTATSVHIPPQTQ